MRVDERYREIKVRDLDSLMVEDEVQQTLHKALDQETVAKKVYLLKEIVRSMKKAVLILNQDEEK